ncbi:MAG: cyclic pyranopterin monophosphate synthase MoaC [Alphaproteobacteria bacterium]|nr:MAG: cyclic pyranopterin monophosphate synthase MoaC [Alphaproteobacteria bacterium]
MSTAPPEQPSFTHLDESGAARMVDVSAKRETVREAIAEGRLIMSPATRALFERQELAKGDALAVARIAGIMGAKKTAELIPLCHPLPLDGIEISLEAVDDGIRIEARARTCARTGVEMEALAAVATAALALYDMGKSVERGMRITGIRLLAKSGGRSGEWRAADGQEEKER